MDPEVIALFIVTAAAFVASAVLNCQLWRSGAVSLPIALFIGSVLITVMCYAIAAASPGFLGGLEYVLAAMVVGAGPSLGLLIGLIVGAILGLKPAAPKDHPAP
ncbi:MAG: hypothetical protein WAT09_15165 [Paracoccaceae bacterium]